MKLIHNGTTILQRVTLAEFRRMAIFGPAIVFPADRDADATEAEVDAEIALRGLVERTATATPESQAARIADLTAQLGAAQSLLADAGVADPAAAIVATVTAAKAAPAKGGALTPG